MYSTLIFTALLVALSAFFSASETALTAANRVRLKTQVEAGDKKAKKALMLINDYHSTLSTLLIGNNIANTLTASLATAFCIEVFEGASDTGVAISTFVVTILIIIFGEVVPKGFASIRSEQMSKFAASPLLTLKYVFKPLVYILEMIKKVLLPSQDENNPSVTEDELKVIIEEIEGEGVIEEDQSELLQSAIDFSDITVDEILTHRVDIFAIEENTTKEEIIKAFIEQRFSRIPVYKGTIDNITGVLNQKDFFAKVLMGENPTAVENMQKCLYVPPKKKINGLMAELQKNKLHMAIITDEHGGTIGIVTLEDILEELVGEIWDEHDEVENPIVAISSERYEASADTDLEELFETLDITLKNTNFQSTTLAGMALEILGKIPEKGESFTYKQYLFKIMEVDEKRIIKLQIDKIIED